MGQMWIEVFFMMIPLSLKMQIKDTPAEELTQL